MHIRDLTLSDVELLRARARESDPALVMDEETFRAFYDRTARAVWAYLSRLTGDPQQADDLLQETFYRFLRAGAAYESEAHRRNSLFRIATNLARDAHRRRSVRPLFVPHDDALMPGSGEHGSRIDQSTDLTRAMGHLKPRDRALLWLAYAEGSSHREIAATLGVKTGSVKLLLFRARRKLASLLASVSPPIPARRGGGES
jgi:RNA polymerase sigma-70 factor (ECF subfamily)